MRVFLDFEASSLAKNSYPIEVAWVWESGAEESWLIRPNDDWTDWDEAAAAIHRIPRETLVSQGQPPTVVAARMIDVLAGHDLLASAPSWDGKWLSVLLRGAGRPRHALRLRDTGDARRELAEATLGRSAETDALLAEVDARFTRGRPAHRALADARHELDWWRAVVAAAHASRSAAGG